MKNHKTNNYLIVFLALNFEHVKIVPSLLEEKIDDYSSLMGILKK